MKKKRLLPTLSILVVASVLLATPRMALADEGIHGLEVEVSGFHITLNNESEWAKGENTVIVTLADQMGMPVTDTEVQILIAPKLAGHAASEADEHSEPETDAHGSEPQGHDAMSGMDTDEATEAAAHEAPSHEEERATPVIMRAADEQGMYVAETHLEKSGVHEILVMFHANGEMIEAGFTVQIPGTSSKTFVLWSFALINVALLVSAGFIKKQSNPVKGTK